MVAALSQALYHDDRALLCVATIAIAKPMIPPPEITRVTQSRVACDGAHDGIPAALGHPRVFLEIDEQGYVDCGYCDRRFVLIGGAADGADQSVLPDHPAGASV